MPAFYRRLLPVLALGCGTPGDAPPTPEQPAWKDWCPSYRVGLEDELDALLDQMTLPEKAAQLTGAQSDEVPSAWGTGTVPRLGVRGFRMVDGPRGVAGYAATATAFPVAMARAATWDPELERRVGAAIGAETAAIGADVLLAPTINVLRHPRWGRSQETYGESPVLLGAMGGAFVRGAQEHVVAVAKHFAANSIENTRFTVDVVVDDTSLREVYLRPFRQVVQDAGVGGVMSAYNKVNGDWCAESAPLLTDVLKHDWGFAGFVVSDWAFGTHSTVASLEAGLDIEMPTPIWYGDPITDAVQAGEVDEAVVDEAVARLLRTQACFGIGAEAPTPDPTVLESEAHKALAREVAAKGAVLLQRDADDFPLPPTATVALVGSLARAPNLGDTGSSSVVPSQVVTIEAGMRDALGDRLTVLPDGPWPPDQADALAAADIAVVVAGLRADDEGEGLIGAGDRASLTLPQAQLDLIDAVASAHDRVVVVLIGGGAILVEDFVDDVGTLVMAWYPGMQGGHGIADLLTGVVAPHGRLPFAVPRLEDDLPPFDNTSAQVTYDRWFGQHHLLRTSTPARYPLGFGLSATTFSIDDARAEVHPSAVTVFIDVTNTGEATGPHVAQVYGRPADDPTAPRRLLGFRAEPIPAGVTDTVQVEIDRRDLATWDQAASAWTEPAAWRLWVGQHAEDEAVTLDVGLGD